MSVVTNFYLLFSFYFVHKIFLYKCYNLPLLLLTPISYLFFSKRDCRIKKTIKSSTILWNRTRDNFSWDVAYLML